MAKDGTIKINTELDSSKAQDAMSSFSGVVKKSIGTAVKTSVATATAALGTMAAYSVSVGSSFEEGMSKVSAISGATGEDIDALTEKAKEMGAKTKFSATEAAAAFEYMAMAGWKTDDMLNGIEGIMNLAAASGEDLATTSDIVTDALTAFGLSAKDSSHFADIMAAASSNANTNVSMLGETFKYVAPVAGALKYTAEDTAVAIGLMANAGIKGSQAGTALRSAISRLVKPTDTIAAFMDRYKISLTNTDGTMKSFSEVTDDLRKKLGGLSESEQSQAAAALFGQEAMSGMLAIINASDSDVAKLKDSINNCDGAAESMADTMQDNLKGSLTIMKSAAEGFGIQVYESIQEPLKNTVDKGTEYINQLAGAFKQDGFNGVIKEAGDIFGELLDKLESSSDGASNIVGPIRDFARETMKLGKTVLPVAVKGVTAISDNLDVLVPLATSSVAAFKAFNVIGRVTATTTKVNAAAMKVLNTLEAKNALVLTTVNGGLTMRQMLLGLMNGQLTASNVLTGIKIKLEQKLNAVMTANPIGAAVVAMTAFLAIGTAITKMRARQTEAEKQHTKELKDAKKATEELRDQVKERKSSYEELSKSQDEQAAADLNQLDHLRELKEELDHIVDKNGKVKEGEEKRAAFITGELSDALGIEIGLSGDQIENYKELRKQIDATIEKKRVEAVLASAHAKYEEAVNNQMKASEDATRSLLKLDEAKINYEKEQIELAKLRKEADQAALDGNQPLLQSINTEIEKRLANIAVIEDEAKTAYDAYEESQETLRMYADDIDRYTALAEAAASGNSAEIEKAITNITAGIKTANNSTEEELKNQVDFLKNHEKQVCEEVKKSTPGYTKAMADQAKEATQAALDELKTKTGQSYDAGSDFGEGFVNGIKEWFSKTFKIGKELGEEALKGTKKSLDSHSPSKKAKKVGKDYDAGYGIGIDENKDLAIKPAKELASDTLDALNVDDLYERIKSVDIPSAMSRIEIASDHRNSRVSDNVVSTVSASENLAWKRQESNVTHLSEDDIKLLAKEFSSVVSDNIAREMSQMSMYANDRELFRMMRKVK